MTQFIAGVYILNSYRGISDSLKSEYYNELCTVTGITGEDAQLFIGKYKNHPKKWQKLLDNISEQIKCVDDTE